MSEALPLRVGVIGLGRAFTLMLPTFRMDPRIRLVAACDPRASARERFAGDFTAPVYEDVEALLADPTVEAVYVASPHEYHVSHACLAASLGKHLLIEKPLALTLQDCDRIIAALDASGVKAVVGHCHSFDAPYTAASRLIKSGAMGSVRMVQALNFTDFMYRPRRPEELDTARGGGVIFSQGAHQVDIVRMLAGQAVRRVRAYAGRWDPERLSEGAYSAMLWFEDGAVASLVYSGYGHFDSDEWCSWTGEMGGPKSPEDYSTARSRLAMAGSMPEAELKAASTYGGPRYKEPPYQVPNAYQHFGPVLVCCDRGDLRPMPTGVWRYGDDAKEFVELERPAIPRAEVVDELFATVRLGVAPLHDARWARATMQVCLAILQSAAEDREISLSTAPAQTYATASSPGA